MSAEQDDLQTQEEPYVDTLQPEQEESSTAEEPTNARDDVDRSSFIHGLAVGLGIGCIATFVIVWISVYFTPRMPEITYENLLSVFVYPLIYLLAVGLIALTAGIVREYFATRKTSPIIR